MAIYNGIDLPTIPVVSTSSYTKICIVHNYITDEYAVIMATTADAITYSNDTYTQDTGVILLATKKSYNITDGAWTTGTITDLDEGNTKYILRPDTITPVWSNFDILKSDGTVLLAASEPIYSLVRLPWSGLKNWIVGVVLGISGENMPAENEEE